jgi:hypothetical protein
MAIFSAGESSSSLCHCEERSDEAIPMGWVRVEIAAPPYVGARNNRKGKVARNDSINVPPPLWAEVWGKAHFSIQPPTSHCPEELVPTATTVPSDLSPTV